MTYTLRPATAGDLVPAWRMISSAFGDGYDEEIAAMELSVVEPERVLVVTAGDEIVATAGALTRDLTVPGAVVPAAYVTAVAVAATHRRRGLLTQLMRAQLESVPEPVAVLWASEGRIYPRFGYGLAAQRVQVEFDNREVHVGGPADPGELRELPVGAALAPMAEVYERVRAGRPGFASRDKRWWDYVTADPTGLRRGASELRAVVHFTGGVPDGYARWRMKSHWEPAGPAGEIHIVELVATGPVAYASLWRFLSGQDLSRRVLHWFLAVDEPVIHLVDEPRALGTRLSDALWVRLVDVPAALAARRYAAPVDVVIEITDPLLPANAGRWRLRGGPAGVTCTRTADAPDLACDVRDLGTVYLGGPTLSVLAAAGRVLEHRPGAVAAASAAFRWHRAPAGIETF